LDEVGSPSSKSKASSDHGSEAQAIRSGGMRLAGRKHGRGGTKTVALSRKVHQKGCCSQTLTKRSFGWQKATILACLISI
jgi:hypothetical protein